jgi:hypothetical protein
MYIVHATPIVAMRGTSRDRAGFGGGAGAWAKALCGLVVRAWMRRVERRIEAAVRQLDHYGLLADLEVSRRA